MSSFCRIDFADDNVPVSVSTEAWSPFIPLNDEDSHGVILPVGKGSIAIVGSREEKLEEVQKQILQSVTWET